MEGERKIKLLSVSPELIDRVHVDRSVSSAIAFRGSTDAALAALWRFIYERLGDYAFDRNRPEIDGTSRLAPYLHFGQIGPLTVALAIRDGPPNRFGSPIKTASLNDLAVLI